MASFVTIAGTAFTGIADGSGNQSAWQPTGITLSETKVGVTLVAADGTRNRVERNAVKRVWTITWALTNTATMQTVRTIQRLMTTFAFVDLEGASYTVQTEDAFEPEFNMIDVADNRYWDVQLVIYQV
jgi:hypothetical protein